VPSLMRSTADIVHAAQWAALRGWLDSVPAGHRQRTSVLDGWTVDHVVLHLARSLDALADVGPLGAVADDTLAVQTVGSYLAGFRRHSAEIAETVRRVAATSSGDRAAEWDAANAQAERSLAALGGTDPLLTARDGVIRLSDYLDTRIVELVVHAGDLARSLPDLPPPPVLPAALERVESVLRQAFREKAGVLGDHPVVVSMPAADFVDAAAGRKPVPEWLPSAVRSQFPLF